jgi:hypothetical protein
MRSAPVARSISTRTSVPHSDVKATPIRLLWSAETRRSRDRALELAGAPAHRERIDLGASRSRRQLEARARPGPARKAVRHRAGHEVARMRGRGERASGSGTSPSITSWPSFQRALSNPWRADRSA